MILSLTITHILLWIAVIIEGLALCALYYINTRLVSRTSNNRAGRELLVGTPFPPITFLSSHGTVQAPSELREQFRHLIFVTPHCGLCRRVLRPVLDSQNSGLQKAAIYCHGTRRSCDEMLQSFRGQHGIRLFFKYRDDPIDILGLAAVPAVVHLSTDGRIVGYTYPLDVVSMEGALRVGTSREL